MRPIECNWSGLTEYFSDLNDTLQHLLDEFEKLKCIPGYPNLMYEDIYNLMYECDDRIIVRYKWRRLSILVDKNLLLRYLKLHLRLRRARPNRHVRGSRRSDL